MPKQSSKTPEVVFNDPCFEDLDTHLGDLKQKLGTIAADSLSQNSERSAVNCWPTNLQIMPDANFGEPQLFIKSWRETNQDRSGQVGRFQVQDFGLRLAMQGEEAYLLTEDNRNYPITTREAFLVNDVLDHAIMHETMSMQVED